MMQRRTFAYHYGVQMSSSAPIAAPDKSISEEIESEDKFLMWFYNLIYKLITHL
jgi:hypothetical protein